MSANNLPPLRQNDLPAPQPLRKMLGPGIILAGLGLGSGEFIIWPLITYQSGFVFFWACLLGVTMQYFINMEITRWTLATGENATTGFCRISKHFAWIFLLLNIIPWMVPAWATSAAELGSWLIWSEPNPGAVKLLAAGGLLSCGIILTAGPVIYETVEKMQLILVTLVMVIVGILAVWLLKSRPDAIIAQATAAATFGAPEFIPALPGELLLGALAFAGAGGTLNLAQSDYIKDKGYGMGHYLGRLTSTVTGRAEATDSTGFLFEPNSANLKRWRVWWRNASVEHFISFFLTCLVCLVLLTLIAYALTHAADGTLTAEADLKGLTFIAAEADELARQLGPAARSLFLLMGIAILLTTELGILDAVTRISTNLVKTNYLRESSYWTESRLYYLFLWIMIGAGIVTLLTAGTALKQLVFAAAMNGGVMFLYSAILIYLNRTRLPREIRMPTWRMLIMVGVVVFFGFFTVRAITRLMV